MVDLPNLTQAQPQPIEKLSAQVQSQLEQDALSLSDMVQVSLSYSPVMQQVEAHEAIGADVGRATGEHEIVVTRVDADYVVPVPDEIKYQLPVAFVVRDNFARRRAIERSYIDAIRGAREQLDIAVPYFYPGHGFRNANAIDAGREDRGLQRRLRQQRLARHRIDLTQWGTHRARYREVE